MDNRILLVLVAFVLMGAAAPTTFAGAAPAQEPASALLGEGCNPDGLIRGQPILPALRPCGVRVRPDGSTQMVAVPGDIRVPEQQAEVTGGWTRLVRPSPERRVNLSMAYLPALKGVVMYGGLVCPGIACHPVDETWLWNGSTWTRLRPPISPPPLHAAAMTYDPSRKELVLFGGETCSPTDCFFSAETWTFDGITWDKKNPVLSPPASAASAMAFDAKSSRVILSGGCAQDRCPGLVGTWSWDGSAWEFEDILTPLPRLGASMTTNPGGGVVLFGGQDLLGPTYAETWVWDGEWVQRQPATSPPSRMYSGATYDGTRAIFFAGSAVTCSFGVSCSGSYLKDTWTWDGEIWTERPADPAPRGGQSLAIAYDATRDEVVRFGGISNFLDFKGTPTTAYESSTWLWDGTAWFERRSPMPEERTQPAIGFHPGTGLLVLTGGNCMYTTTCDTWSWDGQTWTRIAGLAPAPNSRASIISDPETGSALLPLADAVWTLTYDKEGQRWSWTATPDSASPGGNGATKAGEPGGGILEFGAQICSPCTYSDRTWTWRGRPWEEAVVSPKPPGRAFATMTLDPARQNTVLFGGLTSGGQVYFKDTWTWDGQMWTEVAAPGPRDRSFSRLAADPVTGDVMLHGGISGPPGYTVLGDQWLFDGAAWREVTSPGPGPRTEHAVAGYPPASQTILFGGQDANPGRPMNDTWIWTGEG